MTTLIHIIFNSYMFTMAQTQISALLISALFQGIEELLGIRYCPWTKNPQDEEDTKDEVIGPLPPFYVSNGEPPPLKYIQKKGLNCVGFVNTISRYIGVVPHGDWFKHLNGCSVLELYKSEKNYPKGSMLLREFSDEKDPGHLAIIVSDNELVHCYAEVPDTTTYEELMQTNELLSPGTVIEDISKSHSWFDGGTYTHVCLPENWIIIE